MSFKFSTTLHTIAILIMTIALHFFPVHSQQPPPEQQSYDGGPPSPLTDQGEVGGGRGGETDFKSPSDEGLNRVAESLVANNADDDDDRASENSVALNEIPNSDVVNSDVLKSDGLNPDGGGVGTSNVAAVAPGADFKAPVSSGEGGIGGSINGASNSAASTEFPDDDFSKLDRLYGENRKKLFNSLNGNKDSGESRKEFFNSLNGKDEGSRKEIFNSLPLENDGEIVNSNSNSNSASDTPSDIMISRVGNLRNLSIEATGEFLSGNSGEDPIENKVSVNSDEYEVSVNSDENKVSVNLEENKISVNSAAENKVSVNSAAEKEISDSSIIQSVSELGRDYINHGEGQEVIDSGIFCSRNTMSDTALMRIQDPAYLVKISSEYKTLEACTEFCCRYRSTSSQKNESCTAVSFYADANAENYFCVLLNCQPIENCQWYRKAEHYASFVLENLPGQDPFSSSSSIISPISSSESGNESGDRNSQTNTIEKKTDSGNGEDSLLSDNGSSFVGEGEQSLLNNNGSSFGAGGEESLRNTNGTVSEIVNEDVSLIDLNSTRNVTGYDPIFLRDIADKERASLAAVLERIRNGQISGGVRNGSTSDEESLLLDNGSSFVREGEESSLLNNNGPLFVAGEEDSLRNDGITTASSLPNDGKLGGSKSNDELLLPLSLNDGEIDDLAGEALREETEKGAAENINNEEYALSSAAEQGDRDQDGEVVESREGKEKVVKGGGKVVEGEVKVIEGEGEVVEGEGKVVEGEGKMVIEGEGKVVEGEGKVVVEGEGRMVEGEGKVVVEGNGKMVEGEGKVVVEGEDSNKDSDQQSFMDLNQKQWTQEDSGVEVGGYVDIKKEGTAFKSGTDGSKISNYRNDDRRDSDSYGGNFVTVVTFVTVIIVSVFVVILFKKFCRGSRKNGKNAGGGKNSLQVFLGRLGVVSRQRTNSGYNMLDDLEATKESRRFHYTAGPPSAREALLP